MTATTHHRLDATSATPANRSWSTRRPRRGGPATRYTRPKAGTTRKACEHLGEEPQPDEGRSRHQPARPSPLDGPHHRVRRCREGEDQQGVGVVEPEHEGGDRCEGQHGAGEEAGAGPEPPLDGGVEQRHGGDAFQGLGDQDAPRVHAEQPGRQLHHPEGGGRLVDGDEVGGIRGPEEEGLPALGSRLHRGRVEAVGPTRGAQAPQVQGGGGGEQHDQCRKGPTGTLAPGGDPAAQPGGVLRLRRFRRRRLDRGPWKGDGGHAESLGCAPGTILRVAAECARSLSTLRRCRGPLGGPVRPTPSAPWPAPGGAAVRRGGGGG